MWKLGATTDNARFIRERARALTPENAVRLADALPRLRGVARGRAFAVDSRAAHLPPLRGEILDDGLFAPLHGNASFRKLYRGYPAFEARLT